MSSPLVITAAICGGELTRDDTPHLPLTPEELATEATACAAAGAQVIHLHVRDAAGVPSQDPAIFDRTLRLIRERCDALVQFSTGGAVTATAEERLAPVLQVDPGPDFVTFSLGTMNFGRDVFYNAVPLMETFAKTFLVRGFKPEIEIFDAGMLDTLKRFIKKGLITLPAHVDFVLGVPGGMAASLRNLLFLVESLPDGCTWTVAGVGAAQLTLGAHGIALGGHVRVGLEDNIYFRKGELSQGSAPLVARMARIAHELDRPLATVQQTRQLLHLA
ncbi:MAG: 3-keto-5-aminohexanoate cleavage protein [Candidatus Sericytochromatia bacterium]|nr:3-keto-5-aminohexanoate cleavage protein [Candidatus Sericytochromatia bacterium]